MHPERLARGERSGSRLHPEAYIKNRPRGERNGSAKLTEKLVIEIRARVAAGDSQRAIAAAYGISHPTVGGIVARKTWAHVAGGRGVTVAQSELLGALLAEHRIAREIVDAWRGGLSSRAFFLLDTELAWTAHAVDAVLREQGAVAAAEVPE